jgi:hypothetical protein
MLRTIDINKDQQSLVWSPHFLTDVAQTLKLDDLELEPVVSPLGTGRYTIKIDTNQLSLKWKWGNWKQLDITANKPQRTLVGTYLAPHVTEAHWQDLRVANEIELTFFSEDGTSVRTKVQVPDPVNLGSEVQIGPKINGRVRVKLLKPKAHTRIMVELLGLSQEGTFRLRKSQEFPLAQMETGIEVPSGFFGILAVVAKRETDQWLIGAADCHDDGEVVQQRTLNHRLREVIDSRYSATSQTQLPTFADWLSSWPSDSQLRLGILCDLARRHFATQQFNSAEFLLRTYPTGLSRYLTLVKCGLENSDPTALVRSLNQHSFHQALNAALPALGAALNLLSGPAERVWAIQNAHCRNLQKAASEARNDGVGALARELHLMNKREEAIAMWESRQAQERVPAAVRQS